MERITPRAARIIMSYKQVLWPHVGDDLVVLITDTKFNMKPNKLCNECRSIVGLERRWTTRDDRGNVVEMEHVFSVPSPLMIEKLKRSHDVRLTEFIPTEKQLKFMFQPLLQDFAIERILSMNDTECQRLTGLTNDQFNQIMDTLKEARFVRRQDVRLVLCC